MTTDAGWLSRWVISRQHDAYVECSLCEYRVEIDGPGTSDTWMAIGSVLRAIAEDGHDCRRRRRDV